MWHNSLIFTETFFLKCGNKPVFPLMFHSDPWPCWSFKLGPSSASASFSTTIASAPLNNTSFTRAHAKGLPPSDFFFLFPPAQFDLSGTLTASNRWSCQKPSAGGGRTSEGGGMDLSEFTIPNIHQLSAHFQGFFFPRTAPHSCFLQPWGFGQSPKLLWACWIGFLLLKMTFFACLCKYCLKWALDRSFQREPCREWVSVMCGL